MVKGVGFLALLSGAYVSSSLTSLVNSVLVLFGRFGEPCFSSRLGAEISPEVNVLIGEHLLCADQNVFACPI